MRAVGRRARERIIDRAGNLSTDEIVYREILLRDLARLGIEDVFYPVGAAACHSLLYFIVRSIRELGVRRVLEFGVGQSTILLAALQRIDPGLGVMSLESDASWASWAEEAGATSIRVVPLADVVVGGERTVFYDTAVIDGKFDLVVVDGPHGRVSNGRRGSASAVLSCISDNFIVVFDDVHREGEARTADLFADLLEHRGTNFHSTTLKGAKWQRVFSAGTLVRACTF